jgi:uncharacterized Zn finger protein
VYQVTVAIKTLPSATWDRIKSECAHSIDSLIDLLQGRFDQAIMTRLTQRDGGLFPQPREIDMKCSCPDWAGMCKHVAATLYGVGARLDSAPELLFTLRNVDHLELISQAVAAGNLDQALAPQDAALAGADLGQIFGIDLDAGDGSTAAPAPTAAPPRRKAPKAAAKASKPAGKSKSAPRAGKPRVAKAKAAATR